MTVFQKGAVLVAVPLVFQLAFVLVVFRLQNEQIEAEHWASHTKDVIALSHEIRTSVADTNSGIRGYVISLDPIFAQPYKHGAKELPELLNQLDQFVIDNPTQKNQARLIRERVNALLTWEQEVELLILGGQNDQAINSIRTGDGNRLADDFREEIDTFLREEERLDQNRASKLDRVRHQLNILFIVGGILAFATTVGLAYGFRRGIARRFEMLEKNARRLSTGETLIHTDSGNDEIARIDFAFREMASELTQASDRVRDLYDNAPCGYHSVDENGIIISINRTELSWLGYEAVDVIGIKKFSDMLVPTSRSRYFETFAKLKEQGEVSNIELELTCKDGTIFPVLISSSASRDSDGKFLRSRSAITDLTERKQAENEVRRLNEELEGRVAARTSELAEVNRDLLQKNTENEMFVYSVSHDLRSPLVNLQGFSRELEKSSEALRVLLEDTGVPDAIRVQGNRLLTGKMSKSVGFIRSAVLRLSGIIDALLRLSRAGRVEYRLESVYVDRVVAQVIEASQSTISERGATIVTNELPIAWGDQTAIEQVFGNLLGNALTYLDPGRPGIIEIGCVPNQGATNFRTYYVRDNGLGIPEGHRQKIFQAFQRAHPGIGSGEGLGLAIVSRVVERHRGKIWVESTAGEGSAFFFTLPIPPDAVK